MARRYARAMRTPLRCVACVLVAVSAMRSLVVGSPLAQATPPPQTDAGSADAQRRDARETGPTRDGSRTTCRFEIEGGVDGDLACQVMRYDQANEAGAQVSLVLTNDPQARAREPNVQVVINCSGRPAIGYQVGWPAPGCQSAKATISADGVDWTGNTGIQGTFVLHLTSVRPLKVAGHDAFEIHGVLEASLPVSNTFAAPALLHATF